MLTRALGARDAALGIGALTSSDGEQLRRWLVLACICDVADFAATLAGPQSRARPVVLASAAGAAAAGLVGALAER